MLLVASHATANHARSYYPRSKNPCRLKISRLQKHDKRYDSTGQCEVMARTLEDGSFARGILQPENLQPSVRHAKAVSLSSCAQFT